MGPTVLENYILGKKWGKTWIMAQKNLNITNYLKLKENLGEAN
jgi:hypothetical protein